MEIVENGLIRDRDAVEGAGRRQQHGVDSDRRNELIYERGPRIGN